MSAILPETRVLIWVLDPDLSGQFDEMWFKSLDDLVSNIQDEIGDYLGNCLPFCTGPGSHEGGEAKDGDEVSIKISRRIVTGEEAASCWDDLDGLEVAEVTT